ncbi:MAG: hypothetical protein K5897_00130 [Eubacterium sp.]|nr:hypothetical protein [Eubacterium sp.]
MAENDFENNNSFLPQEPAGLTEKDRLLGRASELKYNLKQMDKEISSEEKSIRDEISSKIKKKRDEIEDGYDKKLKEIRGRKKKVASEKEKKVDAGKDSRIKEATRDHVEDSKDTEKELRRLFRKEKIPRLARTKLFYILFMPEGAKDTALMLFGFLVIFAGIPAAVTFVVRDFFFRDASEGARTAVCILIPSILIILALIIVFTINVKVKKKHIDTLRLARRYRKALNTNDKRIREIRRSVEEDADESHYDVDELQSQLDDVLREEEEVQREKKEALEAFDLETAEEIRSEVESRRGDPLREMKEKRAAAAKELEQTEQALSAISMVIVSADQMPGQASGSTSDQASDQT